MAEQKAMDKLKHDYANAHGSPGWTDRLVDDMRWVLIERYIEKGIDSIDPREIQLLQALKMPATGEIYISCPDLESKIDNLIEAVSKE